MLMADTMSIFFVILGMMLALPGLWLLCRGLWPDVVAAATGFCYHSFWSSFLTGMPITIVMLVVSTLLFKRKAFNLQITDVFSWLQLIRPPFVFSVVHCTS